MSQEYLDKLDSRQNGKSEEEGTKTEVVVKAKRRQHSAEYKLRILREIDGCKGKGEVGALLRREGLYSSLVSKWREQRERGSETGFLGNRRGPKVDANAVELARLQRENKRLQEKLERAELIIDVQKKVARLLGVTLADNDLNKDS
jgi:transposase-like protein